MFFGEMGTADGKVGVVIVPDDLWEKVLKRNDAACSAMAAFMEKHPEQHGCIERTAKRVAGLAALLHAITDANKPDPKPKQHA